MAEVKEEFLERYADFIRGLAKEKSPQLFTNGGIAYASQLMAVLFENTDKEARIFCQGFKPDLITTHTAELLFWALQSLYSRCTATPRQSRL